MNLQNLDWNTILVDGGMLAFLILAVVVVVRLLAKPIKALLKFVIHAATGILVFYAVNYVGGRFFGFTMEPQITQDFVMPCFYCEKHPGSPFIKDNMVGIYTETGSWNLSGSELRRLEGAEIVERKALSTDEIPAVLHDIFGMI